MAGERLTYVPVIKGLILGSTRVGKSALLHREIDNPLNFIESSFSIRTSDFKVKLYNVDINGETQSAKGQWWDVPDTGRFRDWSDINRSDHGGTQVLFLVFDVTDEQSFQDIIYLIHNIRRENAEIPIVLIGNQCDRGAERVVTTQRGQALANQYKMPYIETSARRGINVSEAFRMGLQLAINKQFHRRKEQKPAAPAQPPQRIAAPGEPHGFSRWQWGLMIVTVIPILFYAAYKLGQWLYNKGQALWAARNANAVAAAVTRPPAAPPPNIHQELAQLRVAELEHQLQTAEQKLQEAKQAPQRHEIINRHTRRQLAMDLLPEAKMASEVAHSAIYSKIGANAHSIPNDYICTISAEIMTDPVIVNDHTYERSALLEWLTAHDIDPLDPSYKLTGPDLSVIQRNRSLKGLIEKWIEDNTVVAAPAPAPAPVSLRR